MSASFLYDCFKAALFNKLVNLNGGDTINMCLVNSTYAGLAAATDGTSTVSSTPTYASVIAGNGYEVTGTGYTAGGQALSGPNTALSGNTLNFGVTASSSGDVTWSSSSITASGAVLYDAATGMLIAYLDFGGSQVSAGGNFTVSWSGASYILIAAT